MVDSKKDLNQSLKSGDAPLSVGREEGVLAGFFVRFAAAIYDLGIIFALAFIVFIPVTIAEQALGAIPDWLKGLLTITVFWAYFVGFWTRSGETTGMRPWHLRVVMVNTGKVPSLVVASVRFVALILTWLAGGFVLLSILTGKTQNTTYASIALLPLLSLVFFALSHRRQALHDWVAGVIVVRVRKKNNG